MKECRKCQKVYPDDTLNFCLTDGARLYGKSEHVSAAKIAAFGTIAAAVITGIALTIQAIVNRPAQPTSNNNVASASNGEKAGDRGKGMSEGVSAVIEYIWNDGVPRYAQLRNTNPSLDGQQALNPRWYVWHRDDNNNNEYEWINYVNPERQSWRVRLHCKMTRDFDASKSQTDEYIKCTFEHKPFEGDAGHEDDVIRFLDWDQKPWEARINKVYPPFPAQPLFTLRRL